MLSDKIDGSPNRALYIAGTGGAPFIDGGENVLEIAARPRVVKRTLIVRDGSRAPQSLRRRQIALDAPGPGPPG